MCTNLDLEVYWIYNGFVIKCMNLKVIPFCKVIEECIRYKQGLIELTLNELNKLPIYVDMYSGL